MDQDSDKMDECSDTEDTFSLRPEEVKEEEEDENEQKDEDEEEDDRIFNAWMQQYRAKKQEKSAEENEEEGTSDEGRTESRISLEQLTRLRTDRRASLPCPSTLSSLQLSRLHSSTQTPVTAKVLLRRSSSRRLLPPPHEDTADTDTHTERRLSITPTTPGAVVGDRRGQFRRRSVMSLGDADRLCLICHNDLFQGSGGTRELQCTHTFHRECIEEWLWRKQSCPTCHIHVSMPKPVYWNSSRVKVP